MSAKLDFSTSSSSVSVSAPSTSSISSSGTFSAFSSSSPPGTEGESKSQTTSSFTSSSIRPAAVPEVLTENMRRAIGAVNRLRDRVNSFDLGVCPGEADYLQIAVEHGVVYEDLKRVYKRWLAENSQNPQE